MTGNLPDGFWMDPRVHALGCNDRYVLVWLLTSPRLSMAGTQVVSPIYFEVETKMKRKSLEEALPRLGEWVERVGEWVVVKDFVYSRWGRGSDLTRNNIWKAVVKAFKGCPPAVQSILRVNYPELEGGSKGVASPSEGSGGLDKGIESSEKPLARGVRETGSPSTHIHNQVPSGGVGEDGVVEGVPGGDGEKSAGVVSNARVPSLEEVKVAAAGLGGSEGEALNFYDYYEGQARTGPNGNRFWVTSSGTVVTSWRSKLSQWLRNPLRPASSGPKAGADVAAAAEAQRAKARLHGELREALSCAATEEERAVIRGRIQAEIYGGAVGEKVSHEDTKARKEGVAA